jgi:hypothetical protein
LYCVICLIGQLAYSKDALPIVAGINEGLYIKGQMGIMEGGTLASYNYLYLDNASVKGAGSFIITSEAPQTILAKNSDIDNLAIDNPTTVSLVGDLTINNSLAINRGVFDASKGHLIMADSVNINLLNGAKIINRPSNILPDITHNNLQNNPSFQFCCFEVNNYLGLAFFSPITKPFQNILCNTTLKQTSIEAPPPEFC